MSAQTSHASSSSSIHPSKIINHPTALPTPPPTPKASSTRKGRAPNPSFPDVTPQVMQTMLEHFKSLGLTTPEQILEFTAIPRAMGFHQEEVQQILSKVKRTLVDRGNTRKDAWEMINEITGYSSDFYPPEHDPDTCANCCLARKEDGESWKASERNELLGLVQQEYKMALAAYERNTTSDPYSIKHTTREQVRIYAKHVSTPDLPSLSSDRKLAVRSYYGGPMYSSIKPIHQLRRITIPELRCPKRHTGEVLICRVLTREIVGERLSFVSVFNVAATLPILLFESEAACLFGIGTILAIREPYVKHSLSARPVIRVDVPSDIITLRPEDARIKGVTFKIPPRIKLDYSLQEWKERGNERMKSKNFILAISFYSMALSFPPSQLSESIEFLLLLNRAQAYNNAGLHGSAYRDCLRASDLADSQKCAPTEAQRIKINWRMADATYHLRAYSKAMEYTMECKTAGVEQAKGLYHKIGQRMQEEDVGLYDWTSMFECLRQPIVLPLDVADFIGPVEPEISLDGIRRMLTTQNVRAGDLLSVQKAAVWVPPTNVSRLETVSLDFDTGLIHDAAFIEAVSQVVNNLIDNNGTGEYWMPQCADDTKKGSLPVATPNNDNERLASITSPLKIDVKTIRLLIAKNAHRVSSLGPIADSKPRAKDLTLGVFPLASFMRHSCVANTSKEYWGDIIVVRALSDLPTGSEVFTSIFPADLPYPERQARAKARDFECNCELCKQDQADQHDDRTKMMLEDFEPLLQTCRNVIGHADLPSPKDPANRKAMKDLLDFQKKLQATYGHNRTMKLESFPVWRAMADLMSFEHAGAAIKAEANALKCLGFIFSTDVQRKAHGRTIEHIGPAGGDWRVISVLMIAHLYFAVLKHREEGRAWAATAYWVHEVIIGGGLYIFRARFKQYLVEDII